MNIQTVDSNILQSSIAGRFGLRMADPGIITWPGADTYALPSVSWFRDFCAWCKDANDRPKHREGDCNVLAAWAASLAQVELSRLLDSGNIEPAVWRCEVLDSGEGHPFMNGRGLLPGANHAMLLAYCSSNRCYFGDPLFGDTTDAEKAVIQGVKIIRIVT